MSLKNQLIIGLVAIVAAFAAGRYSNQVVETSKTVNQEDKNVQKDTHEKVVTVITEQPDGSKVTNIVKTKDVVADITDDKSSVNQTSKTVGSSPKTTINALGGIDIHTKLPTYGASISRELIGPISIGVFGLTSGVAGVSLGITF